MLVPKANPLTLWPQRTAHYTGT